MIAWVWYVVKIALFATVILIGVGLVIGVVNDYRDLRDHFDDDL